MSEIAWDEVVDEWTEVFDDSEAYEDDDHDRVVLECARSLAADPGGALAGQWVFGLVMMVPYVGDTPGDGVFGVVLDALHRADEALKGGACTHDAHPYEADLDRYIEDLGGIALHLAGADPDWWDRGWSPEQWACPRNAAGLARVGMDYLEPGSVTDVPPRLPAGERRRVRDLLSVLEGYPPAWISAYHAIAESGIFLSKHSSWNTRAGEVLVVMGATPYAVSGIVRKRWVLDRMIKNLETVPSDADGTPCPHGAGGHPKVPRYGADLIELGVHLGDSGGRGVLRRKGMDLEPWLCPAFVASNARDTLDELRAARELLFGYRDTGHLDPELLLNDGQLDIERFAERFADPRTTARGDLGVWAARRYPEATHERERVVLLLAAHEALRKADPGPPIAIARDIRALFRTLADAPQAEGCTHEGEHPSLHGGVERLDLRPVYAADTAAVADAVSCPRFLASLAREGVRSVDSWCGEEEEAAAS
ncbi:hypothetical protein P8605_27255 [Streptomyces sp. T-3]|nr:hypothetical protein [Streptomyces sp. T-3]